MQADHIKEDNKDPSKAWTTAAPLLQELDRLINEGLTAIVKMDGERGTHKYTVVLSGGRLGERFFRQDGDCLAALLGLAIDFYNPLEDRQPRFDA